MKKYTHLSTSNREIIANKLAKGTSKRKIASLLSVHISTIYREINRNSITQRSASYIYYNTYFSSTAQLNYLKRKKNNNHASKFTKDITHIIKQGLKADLSFSTICNIRHKTDKSFLCSRTLYNYFKSSLITIPKNYRLKLKKENMISDYIWENPDKDIPNVTSEHKKYDNLVDTNFDTPYTYNVLCTDIIYLVCNSMIPYMSAIKDAATEKVVAYEVSENLKIHFVLDMVKQLNIKLLNGERMIHLMCI